MEWLRIWLVPFLAVFGMGLALTPAHTANASWPPALFEPAASGMNEKESAHAAENLSRTPSQCTSPCRCPVADGAIPVPCTWPGRGEEARRCPQHQRCDRGAALPAARCGPDAGEGHRATSCQAPIQLDRSAPANPRNRSPNLPWHAALLAYQGRDHPRSRGGRKKHSGACSRQAPRPPIHCGEAHPSSMPGHQGVLAGQARPFDNRDAVKSWPGLAVALPLAVISGSGPRAAPWAGMSPPLRG